MAITFREEEDDEANLKTIMNALKVKTKTKAIKLGLKIAANILK